MKDYYHILEIDRKATEHEVRKAFRKLAMIYHPDVSKSADAHNEFIMITEAYETLIDIDRRYFYDKLYDKYFYNDSDYSNADKETLNDFENYGRQKAEVYSEMELSSLMKEVVFHAGYVFPYTFVIVFIFVGLAAELVAFTGFIMDNDTSNGNIFFAIFGAVFLYMGYKRYKETNEAYKIDREINFRD